jgi:hypothetical protein
MNANPAIGSLSKTTLLLTRRLLLVGLTALPAFGQANDGDSRDQPAIRFLEVPPSGGGADRMETIAGEVSGVNTSELKVVIFSLAGGTWFVQPFTDAPYTDIDSNNRFETEVHLGIHYAGLLVRPSYSPPATTGALPSKGGDVLAVTEQAAGRATAPSSEPVQMWWLIVAAIVLLSIIALTRRTESFVSAIEAFLSRVFEGSDRLSGSSLRNVVDWLASHYALLMLLGLICFVIACASAYADYFILDQSLTIFWPISGSTWVLAANIVALQALIGICLHLCRDKGKLVRRLLYGLLIVLLFSQFTIAYLRVVEIEAATKMEQSAIQVGNDAGSLTINDPSSVVEDQPAASNDLQTEPGGGKNYFSLYAILSGLITVACALSETFGMYAAVSYAGAALVWLIASPVVGALALVSCAFRFLSRSRIVEVAKVILAALIDALSKLGSLVVSGARSSLQGVRKTGRWLRTLPRELAHSYRSWRKARLSHREEVKRLRDTLKLERKYALEMLEIELRAKKEDAEAHWNHHASMTRKLHEAVENIFEGYLTGLKNSSMEISDRLSEEIVEVAAEKICQDAEPVVERVSSAIAEVYRKTNDLILSADGHKCTTVPPR